MNSNHAEKSKPANSSGLAPFALTFLIGAWATLSMVHVDNAWVAPVALIVVATVLILSDWLGD